jgi:hypothetical protein
MREKSSDLAKEYANELATPRHGNAEQLLGSQTECVFLIHRRDIVEPVKVRQRLQVRFMLDQLFSATMQQSNVRINAHNDFAVELKHKPQDTMRRRMLGPKINSEIAKSSFGHATSRYFGGTPLVPEVYTRSILCVTRAPRDVCCPGHPADPCGLVCAKGGPIFRRVLTW